MKDIEKHILKLDGKQVRVDWEKWERDEYNPLSVYGKIWHHAREFLISAANFAEKCRLRFYK